MTYGRVKIVSKKSLLAALIIGGVAGHHIDDIVEKYNFEVATRYPLKVEYNIMENCISNYDKPLARSTYESKKDVCLCALEKTERVYDYARYQSDQDTFLAMFEINAYSCMNKL